MADGKSFKIGQNAVYYVEEDLHFSKGYKILYFIRYCDPPVNGGNDCEGEMILRESCNEEKC